jgi:integrase
MGAKVREKPKGSGNYWVFVHHKGKRTSKKVGRDLKKAMEAAEKINAKLTLADFDIETERKSAPPFKKVAERWLEIHIKSTKRKSTYTRYQSMLKLYINPKIGAIEISKLSRGDVIKALRSIHAKGKSKSSVGVGMNVVSGVCEYAIDEEHIKESPCSGVMKRLGFQRKKYPKTVTAFTAEEVEAVLDKCKNYRPEWYPFFLVAFRTGLRLGEILALEWSDINWRESYIMVQRSFCAGRTGLTKSGKPRRVDMTDQLKSVLRKLNLKRREEALKEGKDEPVPVIFHTDGEPTSQNTIRNIWKRLLDKCGIEYRKFHCARHTFASLLISRGESLAYVKELMGHHSIQITVDIYGHILPTQNRSILNSLDTPKSTPDTPNQKVRAVTN